MVRKTSLKNHKIHPSKQIKKTYDTGKHANHIKLESGQVVDDEFLDNFCAINRKDYEKYTKRTVTSGKAEQLKHWFDRIQKMKKLIKEIRKDSEMTTADKRKKIQRCLDIIRGDKNSITNAIEYLKIRSSKDAELFGRISSKTR